MQVKFKNISKMWRQEVEELKLLLEICLDEKQTHKIIISEPVLL